MNRNDIWKFGTLSVSPFDWLEASYFYYRPSDLIWEGDLVRGHYLDKGFNVKFIYKSKYKYLPNIALGLDDFAGTGYFTREYLVSTFDSKNLKSSIGMGWGKFASKDSYKNPLSSISESFVTITLLFPLQNTFFLPLRSRFDNDYFLPCFISAFLLTFLWKRGKLLSCTEA